MAREKFPFEQALDADIAAMSNQEEPEPLQFSSQDNLDTFENLAAATEAERELERKHQMMARKSSLLQPEDFRQTRNQIT